jgi:hypothetical protein
MEAVLNNPFSTVFIIIALTIGIEHIIVAFRKGKQDDQ